MVYSRHFRFSTLGDSRWITRTVCTALRLLAALVASAHAQVSERDAERVRRIFKAWRQAREFDAAEGTSVHSALAVATVTIGLWLLLLVVMLFVMLAAAWYVAASLLRW